MLVSKQIIFAKNVALLINYIFSQGYTITFGEAWRTQEQAHIYALEHKGIEHSLHCKRLAVDLNLHDKDGKYITDPKSYEFAGKYWCQLDRSNRWGGHFKYGCAVCDCTHFEMQDL